ncbi:MAG TPA: hypothetical protein V6D08_08480 [Candidatus Obscuribacterales bacterium]
MSKQEAMELQKSTDSQGEQLDFSPEKTAQKLLEDTYKAGSDAGKGAGAKGAEKHGSLPNVEIEEGKLQKEAGKVGDSVKEALKEIANGKKLDFVDDLPTGDTLVRVAGQEILLMPNGDRLIVYPSGAWDFRGDGRIQVTSKHGVTTITDENGGRVTFDKEGLLSIARNKEFVTFPRKTFEKPHFPSDGIPHKRSEPGWEKTVPGDKLPNSDRPRSSQGSLRPNESEDNTYENKLRKQ